MELKLNLVLAVVLLLAWTALVPTGPSSVLQAADPEIVRLATLEDAFARSRTDATLARELAETYLEQNRAEQAIVALRRAEPEVLEHPMVAHRLAQAYESVGRLRDAFSTAQLAYARCARSIGTVDAPSGTPIPRYLCDERDHVILHIHRVALARMMQWGVTDPRKDPRSRLAYDAATRRARVAQAE